MKHYKVSLGSSYMDTFTLTVRAENIEAIKAHYCNYYSFVSVRQASAAEVRQTKARGCMILTIG